MEPTISKPLTLSGRYFSKKELRQIQETVKMFSNLSRTELAFTVCEHLSWITPKGSNKINSCLSALEHLENLGYIKLPQKEIKKKRVTKKIVWSDKTVEESQIICPLEEIVPIEIGIVKDKDEVCLWNEYVDRYHYLGYKHPIGANLRYFIV
ncbi:MAG: Druantia anti-phage system protein DruA, partial [bacterium]